MDTSFLVLAAKWKDLGCPPPLDLPNATRAETRARDLLRFADGLEEVVVRSEEDRDAMHALVHLAGSDPDLIGSAADLLERSRWTHDAFGERSALLFAIRELRTRTAASRTIDLPDSDSSPATLLGRPAAQVQETLRALASQKDAEGLRSLCEGLRKESIHSPREAAASAIRLYEILWRDTRCDGRARGLGELALVGASAKRLAGELSEADEWVRLAAIWLTKARGSEEDFARVSFQYLALALEKGELENVLKSAGGLRQRFLDLGNHELALRVQYLHAAALKELGRPSEALGAFDEILAASRKLMVCELTPLALVSRVQIYCDLGDVDNVEALVAEALREVVKTRNSAAAMKLQWGVANLFRKTDPERSIGLFRQAREEAETLGIASDAAALRLSVAEVLLSVGRSSDAAQEIRLAFPTIDRLRLTRHGLAAKWLLAKSLGTLSIDSSALSELARLVNRTCGK